MKKKLSLVLVGLLAISALASCGKTEQGADAPKNAEAAKTSEISVMIFDRGNAPQGEGTVDNNRWTKYVNEEMGKQGVAVKFIPVPRSEENQKIPVMMASQTAPDITLTYNFDNVNKWNKDGGITDITESFDKNGAELKEYLGEEVLKQGVDEEGKRFAIPARRAITANLNAFIRKDWLDKLGMAIPTNQEELYTVLKAFKEKDPGGVGSDKVIAYGGSETNDGALLSMSYLTIESPEDYTAKEIALPSGGSYVTFAYQDDSYAEFLKFRNKMYNEGLTDPEFFTSKFQQKEKEAFVAGTLGYWENDVASNVDPTRGNLLQSLKQSVPDAEMVAIPPFKNINDGNTYVPVYSPVGALNFIPKTAKNPDAAIKYLNFLAGEGGHTIYFGIEGVNYEMVDGLPNPIDVALNATQLEWLKNDMFLIGNSGYFKNEEDFIKTNSKSVGDFASYYVDDYELALEGTRLPHSIYTSPTQFKQSANLDKVYGDYKVKLITCKPEEFDGILAEMKAELKKYGIEDILKERQDYYNSQK